MNSQDVADVVTGKFGKTMKDAGVKHMLCDNDRKLHSKVVCAAWKQFEINVWPGAGKTSDSDIGGFTVNRPDCMVLDQSVNNTIMEES